MDHPISIYPVEQAKYFVQSQFGADEKWVHINQAIWDYFGIHENERLGLSDVTRLASDMELDIHDFLAVLGLLSGPEDGLIRLVYYRRSDSSREIIVPASEVIGRARQWWANKESDDSESKRWLAETFVGWEPVIPS